MRLAAWPRYPIGGYELDFALQNHLVDIEADGELYHSSLEAASKRDRKDAWLESRGYRVLHLTGSVIMNDSPLVERLIRETVENATLRPKTTISTVEPGSLATLEATVLRLKSIREVKLPTGERTRVRNGKLRDETGEIPLVLWSDEVEMVAMQDKIRVVDGWVSEYMGHPQISLGKRGKLEVVRQVVAPQRAHNSADEPLGA